MPAPGANFQHAHALYRERRVVPLVMQVLQVLVVDVPRHILAAGDPGKRTVEAVQALSCVRPCTSISKTLPANYSWNEIVTPNRHPGTTLRR